MERHEALRLILGNLDEVISYLKRLKSLLEPEFDRKGRCGWLFHVGVDVYETSVKGSIAYKVIVYGDAFLRVCDVLNAVKAVEPTYLGSIIILTNAVSYSRDPFLELTLLQDIKMAMSRK